MPNLGDTSLKANPQSLGILPVDVTWMQDRLNSTNPTDWFDFNLSQASTFSTRISWNGNTGANLKLSVYNANNQLLGSYSSPNAASVTSGYDTSIKYSDTVLPAGKYRVEVVDLNKVAVGYELKLSNALAPATPTPTPSTPTPSADTTPPTLVNHTPSNNSVVSNPQDFVFNFSESVKQGTGTITIANLSKGGGRTIDIQNPSAGTDNTGNSISVNGSQMTLHLGTPISNDSAIEVTMSGGGVTDLAGNVYAGLAKGQFDFSTPTTVNTTPTTPAPVPVTPAPIPAADNDGTVATAQQLNSLVVGTTPNTTPFRLDSIGGGDNNDFYKFRLEADSNFAARLSYASTNPLLKIYQKDGITPISAVLSSEPDTQSSNFPSTNTQKITANLAAGDYYVQVAANGSTGTDYGLRLSNTPITTQTPSTPVTPPVTPPTTTPVDTTLPILSSNFPANTAKDVAKDTNIVLTFSEPVKAGTGNIDIYNLTTMGISEPGRKIDVNDTTQVIFSGDNKMEIRPTKAFTGGSQLLIKLHQGLVKDMAGNALAVDYTTPAAIALP